MIMIDGSMKTKISFFDQVKEDFQAQLQGRRGYGDILAALLFGRGFHTLISYRIQRVLLPVPIVGKFFAKIMRYISCAFTGCDISFHAKLSGGIYIPHPTGIVIGDNVEIGGGTTILQQVTLGTKIKGGLDYPIVGEFGYLGAGSKILGRIVIGDHAVIGANAVVLQDVPRHGKAVGIPARIIEREKLLKSSSY